MAGDGGKQCTQGRFGDILRSLHFCSAQKMMTSSMAYGEFGDIFYAYFSNVQKTGKMERRRMVYGYCRKGVEFVLQKVYGYCKMMIEI